MIERILLSARSMRADLFGYFPQTILRLFFQIDHKGKWIQVVLNDI